MIQRLFFNIAAILLFSMCNLSAFAINVKDKEIEIHYLQYNVTKLQQDVVTLDSQNLELRKENTLLHSKLDSLSTVCNTLETSISSNIQRTTNSIASNQAKVKQDIRNIFIYGCIAFLAIAALSTLFYFLTRRKIGLSSQAIKTIKQAHNELSEQQVALDNRLTELFDHQLKNEALINEAAQKSENLELDHSLVLSIAGELVRIEQNLAFMDPKTKGVSQLRNRTKAIISTLNSKGYEIPNLVGTEFKEGMNYDAVMEEDEDMEPGIMRIKRVTKPCVMYDGKMIQTAKVVVAYNPNN